MESNHPLVVIRHALYLLSYLLSLERRTGTENQFPPPNGAKARFGDKVAAVPR